MDTDAKVFNRKLLNIVVIFLVCGAIVAAVLVYLFVFPGVARDSSSSDDETDDITVENTPTSTSTDIDYTELPLGDGLYASEPRKGYVYSCASSFNGGGAFEQGPWIDAANGTWDLTKKITVSGNVTWPQAYFQAEPTNGLRVVDSVDLPYTHGTGVFPIASSEEAYSYDRNPNSISENMIEVSLPMNPELLDQPECVGGEVGIATTGVLIFNAFDAAGRDAVATEVQDNCQGHPQEAGYYHYHGYSDCFEDNASDGEHSELLGYALDGFGIYGLYGENGEELSSSDLDECHGHTHEINWDGEQREMFHYHFTQDYPYTVSCFRGEPVTRALSAAGGGANAPGQENMMPVIGIPPKEAR